MMKKRTLFSLTQAVVLIVFTAGPLAAQEPDRKFEDAARQLEEHARKITAEIDARFNGPEWQEKMKKIEQAAATMSERVNSPEWQAQLREMDQMSKNIDAEEQVRRLSELAARHAAEASEISQQKREMQQLREETRKMREEIRRYFDSAEWKEQMRQLQEATRKLGSSR